MGVLTTRIAVTPADETEWEADWIDLGGEG
jgi:hypothetical protein